MTFTLRLHRDKSRMAHDSAAPADNAVSHILAWAVDNLTPDEIQNLIDGLRTTASQAMDSRRTHGRQFGSAKAEADFERMFPDAARIGAAL